MSEIDTVLLKDAIERAFRGLVPGGSSVSAWLPMSKDARKPSKNAYIVMRAALLASGYPQNVAELEREAASSYADHMDRSRELNNALDELTRLRAENEAMRKDADRYRWWRENIGYLEEDSLGGCAFSYQAPMELLNSGTEGQLMDFIIADFEIAQEAAIAAQSELPK